MMKQGHPQREKAEEDRERWAGLPAYSQVSMSAEANFPVAPKWILMNFPWGQMDKE